MAAVQHSLYELFRPRGAARTVSSPAFARNIFVALHFAARHTWEPSALGSRRCRGGRAWYRAAPEVGKPIRLSSACSGMLLGDRRYG